MDIFLLNSACLLYTSYVSLLYEKERSSLSSCACLSENSGGRCLVTSEIIQRTYDEANRYGAAAAAEAMIDTVKPVSYTHLSREKY